MKRMYPDFSLRVKSSIFSKDRVSSMELLPEKMIERRDFSMEIEGTAKGSDDEHLTVIAGTEQKDGLESKIL